MSSWSAPRTCVFTIYSDPRRLAVSGGEERGRAARRLGYCRASRRAPQRTQTARQPRL